jgi:hypothetical protein
MAFRKVTQYTALEPFDSNDKISVYSRDFNALIDSLDDSVGTWQVTTFNLTQAQVRTLESANGGNGYKLFDSPGSTKTIEIRRVTILFDKTSGTESSVVDLEVYETTYTRRFQFPSFNFGFIGKTALSMPVYINPIDSQANSYYANKAYYLYTTANLPDYDGTMQVIVEHRTLELAI